MFDLPFTTIAFMYLHFCKNVLAHLTQFQFGICALWNDVVESVRVGGWATIIKRRIMRLYMIYIKQLGF